MLRHTLRLSLCLYRAACGQVQRRTNRRNNKPLTGTVGVTFSLYQESQGGAPLWVETQNVHPIKRVTTR
jgi:hypothetical protein